MSSNAEPKSASGNGNLKKRTAPDGQPESNNISPQEKKRKLKDQPNCVPSVTIKTEPEEVSLLGADTLDDVVLEISDRTGAHSILLEQLVQRVEELKGLVASLEKKLDQVNVNQKNAGQQAANPQSQVAPAAYPPAQQTVASSTSARRKWPFGNNLDVIQTLENRELRNQLTQEIARIEVGSRWESTNKYFEKIRNVLLEREYIRNSTFFWHGNYRSSDFVVPSCFRDYLKSLVREVIQPKLVAAQHSFSLRGFEIWWARRFAQ